MNASFLPTRGRELDVLFAQQVLGLHVTRDPQHPEFAWFQDNHGQNFPLPLFSTKLSDTMRALNNFHSWDIRRSSHGHYRVILEAVDATGVIQMVLLTGHELPELLCQAGLKLMAVINLIQSTVVEYTERVA